MQVPHPKRWLILFVVLAAECMDLLDGTVVNVAAPTIHNDLHTSSTGLQWIVGGYALAIAVGLLVGGRLGDLFGRRRMFLIGAAGFTAASTVCAFAPTTTVLIAARLTQGLFGAMMIPQGLGVIREVFPADELPKAFGLFGPVMGSAAMIGPIIGGALIALNLFGSGWRMVFLINLPLGVLAVCGAAALLPRAHGRRHAQRLDLAGAVLAGVARAGHRVPADRGPPARLARLDVRFDRHRRGAVRPVRPAPAAPGAGRARPAGRAEHLHPPWLHRRRAGADALLRRHGRVDADPDPVPAAG